MRIAWVIPGVIRASGGTRTIVQAVNSLSRSERHECAICINDVYADISLFEEASEVLASEYRLDPSVEVIDISHPLDECDCLVATMWTTVETVWQSDVSRKVYFVQDYEPWFYPMGTDYLLAKGSYRKGLVPLTIGRWLAHKLESEFETQAAYFDFCADKDIYAPGNAERKRALCAVFQPEKPRRCDAILIDALRIVREFAPDVEINLYGSDAAGREDIDFECNMLGVLTPEQCNALYNSCQLGVCCSASNPSRIPFEMMAAGLPVVDIFGENTSFDYPAGGVALAMPDCGSIATAILRLLAEDGERTRLSEAGLRFMEPRPLESELDSIVSFFDDLAASDWVLALDQMPDQTNHEGIEASENVLAYLKRSRQRLSSQRIQERLVERIEMLENIISGDAFRLVLSCPDGFDDAACIKVAIWAAEDQSDLAWYELASLGDAKREAIVFCDDHAPGTDTFNVHVYAAAAEGEEPSFQRAFMLKRLISADAPAKQTSCVEEVVEACDLGELHLETESLSTKEARKMQGEIKGKGPLGSFPQRSKELLKRARLLR